MAAPNSPDLDARIVGRYALYGEIAAGGMATVHFGRLVGPVGFSRTVAIKRLHPQFAKDPEFVSMFLDEARLAARIAHPNVVSTLDVVPLEGELFLVMEYVQGESLSKLIRGARRAGRFMPVPIVAAIMGGALHGLHAAHEAKSERGEPLRIVHRDISPQNILVGVDGVARVLDFGVAKAAMRAQTTRDGQMKGKVSYMAPEQLRGQAVDRRTDIFAAGVVLWEALCGRRLFDGPDAGAVLTMVLEAAVAPPSSVVSGVSPELDQVVLTSLARDPNQRFQTAREFAVALENACEVALSRHVGEWVEDLSGEALSQRAAQIAEIESVSTVGGQAVGGAAFHEQYSSPGASRQLPAEGSSSQVTNLTAASSPDHSVRRRQGTYAVLIGVAAALGIALVVVVVALVRRAGEPAVEAAIQPPSSALPAASAEPPAEEIATGSEAKSETEAEADAAAKDREATAEKEDQVAELEAAPTGAPAPPAPRPVYRPRPRPAPKPAAKPKANCNPPYTLDENGIRRLKPECL